MILKACPWFWTILEMIMLVDVVFKGDVFNALN